MKTSKKNKISNTDIVIYIMIIFFTIVITGLVISITTQYQNKQFDKNNICIPKVSGIYHPLDNTGYSIVLFDLKSPIQSNVSRQVDRIFQQIKAGNK